MLTLELCVAGVMLISLIIYMLTGGADFGGGIWDLFATGSTDEGTTFTYHTSHRTHLGGEPCLVDRDCRTAFRGISCCVRGD